jgi:hypothetical protein
MEMVRQGSRLKTGADKPSMKQYVGRAEFFALPCRRSRRVALSLVRPFALSPLRLQYFKRLLDVVRAQNQEAAFCLG